MRYEDEAVGGRAGRKRATPTLVHIKHIWGKTYRSVSYVGQHAVELLKDESQCRGTDRQMSLGNAGRVLSAQCWRLQLAYADFMNDSLLLAAFTEGVCVQSTHTYRSILLLSSFSAPTFLPWK